jgi:hypothetical protein
MKEVTKLMIREFKIYELGYDFLGYKLNKDDILTYHHLIVPKREHGKITRWNGSIIQRIPHDYLHLIQNLDETLYYYLSSEMIDMNIKGYLDMKNIRNINEILCQFENEHDKDRNKKGKLLIKEEYKHRLLKE